MQNKLLIKVMAVVLSAIAIIVLVFKVFYKDSVRFPVVKAQPFWQTQCIDTMKSSRDNARAWSSRSDLSEIIDGQMNKIVSSGATCVALGTPYDEEFVPYLSAWVAGARKAGLHVWFRGNFSGWEGWFSYPKTVTIDQHHEMLKNFIVKNADLFKDGDVFSPSPEAENGGPFHHGYASEYPQYRNYIVNSYTICKDTFTSINKKITCNWASMSGGYAKAIFDEPTIDQMDKLVTIDHYVRDSRDMGEFIDYFSRKYNSKVVIGEFGAPIPDLNGDMTEEEQARFMNHVLWEMYDRRNVIAGVNYWTLENSTTQLVNKDGKDLPVLDVLRDFYQPGVIIGRVVNSSGDGVSEAYVRITESSTTQYTDKNGFFILPIPAGHYTVSASDLYRQSGDVSVIVERSEEVTITLEIK